MKEMKIKIPKAKIVAFCKRWNISEFAIFGSAVHGDFRSDSDVDVLVTFSKDAEVSLFDLVQMKIELEQIFQRSVDLIEKDALENPFRRKEILRSSQVIYGAS